MRRSELLGVTWRALDLDRARLQIDQQPIPATGVPTDALHLLRQTAATLALSADPPVPLQMVAAPRR